MNYQRQVTSVFPSPSKIPYGGFSPVRLQTEIHPPPSPPPPGLSAARIPPAVALISGQKPSHPSTAAHQRANRKGSRLTRSKRHSDRQNQAIPSRGPWLPCGLCCPAGSLLTMASCAPLALTQPLMDLRLGPPTQGPASGGEQEGPQFNWCVCSCVPSPGPRWTSRLHVAVASPTVLAFANFAVARHPQDHARWFLRESCNEAGSGSLCGTAHMIASPHQQGTFTVELSPGGSPRPDVDYDYTGKQPIPAAGLTPARHTTLWAASRNTRKKAGDGSWNCSVSSLSRDHHGNQGGRECTDDETKGRTADHAARTSLTAANSSRSATKLEGTRLPQFR